MFRRTTTDGGGLLAFLDFYTHMEGGALATDLRLANGGFSGPLDIEKFVLRGEPALMRLRQCAQRRAIDRARAGSTPNAVSFSRLHAMLQKSGGRLEVRDGAIANPSIGSTLEGWTDFDNATRWISPARSCPPMASTTCSGNCRSSASMLGGGNKEGLIGVNFRVTGKPSAPSLSVNPLSAIAPGFLRKIFGAFLPHGKAE